MFSTDSPNIRVWPSLTVRCLGYSSFPPAMEANLATSNPVYRFKDGMSRNTARIPKAKWDEHKELLCSLYQENTVSEMLAFMQTEHGFVAK